MVSLQLYIAWSSRCQKELNNFYKYDWNCLVQVGVDDLDNNSEGEEGEEDFVHDGLMEVV